MKDKKIALLIDIDNVKIGADAFNELYEKLNEMGSVVYCKFYGYNDRKHLYLSDFIMNYGYETAPFMRYKKRYSQLDNRIIVDAVKINYTKPEIDTFCIVAGDGDLIPLLVELKSCAKTLLDVNTPYQEQNAHMFDEHIVLSSISEDVETYEPKTKKSTEPKTVKKEKVEKQPKVEKTAPLKTKVVEIESDTNFLEDDYDLSEVLREITERYSELDFTDNSDMDKKVKLIADIEKLIKVENAKGEGMFSENEDVRQIFIDLKGVVDDMKSAL